MNEKPVVVGKSALRHGLDAEFIESMWYDESCEGFMVTRQPPKETNVIAIRFLARPEGTLEMIAEDVGDYYHVFHAQLVPRGGKTSLLEEAFMLYGLYGRRK